MWRRHRTALRDHRQSGDHNQRGSTSLQTTRTGGIIINNDLAISLFSGIGGLDIGFAAAGFEIIAQVEQEKFCQRVLKRHAPEWWPNSAIFADVRCFGLASLPGIKPGDIAAIFGGFPCQPHSIAGKRLGAEDDRDLWPEFRRIIGEFRPRTVLLENVPGILTGYAVHIISDLAALGYDCRWGTIRAADTGAPHKRERWFCMAIPKSDRTKRTHRNLDGTSSSMQHDGASIKHGNPNVVGDTNRQRSLRRNICQRTKPKLTASILSVQIVGDTKSKRLSKRGNRPSKNTRSGYQSKTWRINHRLARTGYTSGNNRIRNRLTQSRMGRAANGVPTWLDEPRWPAGQGNYQYQWEAPRTIGKGIDPHRAAKIKALGNAVLPQIAYALACELKKFLAQEAS